MPPNCGHLRPDHDRAIGAGIDRNLAGRHLYRLAHDVDAVLWMQNQPDV
jgi:hypothetical protein